MRTAGSKNAATPERRRAILDGALALFVENGLDRTSLDAVGARLGITKGSIYHHFKSKEELAVTLYSEAIDRIQADVATVLEGERSAQRGVEGLVRAYLRWFEKNADLGSFVFSVMDGHLLANEVAPIRQLQRAFVEAAAAWLGPFAAEGQVLAMPPNLYVSLIIGPSRDFLRGWFADRSAAAMKAAQKTLPGASWRAIAASR